MVMDPERRSIHATKGTSIYLQQIFIHNFLFAAGTNSSGQKWCRCHRLQGRWGGTTGAGVLIQNVHRRVLDGRTYRLQKYARFPIQCSRVNILFFAQLYRIYNHRLSIAKCRQIILLQMNQHEFKLTVCVIVSLSNTSDWSPKHRMHDPTTRLMVDAPKWFYRSICSLSFSFHYIRASFTVFKHIHALHEVKRGFWSVRLARAP